jgi:hypothetical protein
MAPLLCQWFTLLPRLGALFDFLGPVVYGSQQCIVLHICACHGMSICSMIIQEQPGTIKQLKKIKNKIAAQDE